MGSAEENLVLSDHQTALGERHVVRLSSTDRGAALTVHAADGRPCIEIEISIGPQGPVARLRTAAVQIEASEDVDVRCRAFRVEASEDISLRSQGAVKASGGTVALDARLGSVVARANDDVQLLGENILLNCDRTPPVPDWVTAPLRQAADELLGLEEASGDARLISSVRGESQPDDASS